MGREYCISKSLAERAMSKLRRECGLRLLKDGFTHISKLINPEFYYYCFHMAPGARKLMQRSLESFFYGSISDLNRYSKETEYSKYLQICDSKEQFSERFLEILKEKMKFQMSLLNMENDFYKEWSREFYHFISSNRGFTLTDNATLRTDYFINEENKSVNVRFIKINKRGKK